jgi:SAM-dependent methyltransferase
LANKGRFQCDTVIDMSTHLWDSPLGGQTLALEATALTPFVRRVHGDTILWAGAHADSANALQRCMVRNTVFLQQSPQRGKSDIPSVAAQLEALPFKANSLDGVVLHHALENTEDARVALREITRVLMPGGRVVICGFNPFSLVGLRRLYARVIDDSLSDHRMLNPMRLFDWLTLLGFELDVKPLYYGYGLPVRGLVQRIDEPLLAKYDQGISKTLHSIPFGCLLVVSAVKQAIPMKPQRLTKKERRAMAPIAYPRVANWQRNKS